MTFNSLRNPKMLFVVVPGYGGHTKASSSSNGVCRVACISQQKNNVFLRSKKIFYNSYDGNKEACDLFQTQT